MAILALLREALNETEGGAAAIDLEFPGAQFLSLLWARIEDGRYRGPPLSTVIDAVRAHWDAMEVEGDDASASPIAPNALASASALDTETWWMLTLVE